MTKERREEIVLIALTASIAIHVGLMLLVKPQVMTTIVPQAARGHRHEPTRIVRHVPRPESVSLDAVADLAAKRDAPAAAPVAAAPTSPAPSADSFHAEVPVVEIPVASVPVTEAAAVFDTRPVGLEAPSTPSVLSTRIETPTALPSSVAAPEFTPSVPLPGAVGAVDAPKVASAAVTPPPSRPVLITHQEPRAETYAPAEEVYEKVDERIVAEEKTAVRELVDTADAADLVKFVNMTMTAAESGGWRYFKVMVSPRASLKVVPKDVVMLIDGSGSIGKDRFGGCRRAAQRILRTATNTGDRFNLVVFRNAFSYAFRNWRECDAASFAAGDRWLANQTAHGRTDVFSTIRSVLTLPRDPKRPLIALVVTDGDANSGVSDTAEILSRFTALNDGLVSVYMYGVKSSANRELIDVLTHGNRGESFIFEGWRWNAGEGMEGLSERFRDPVLSDIRIVFAAGTKAEAYPRILRNIYRGGTLEFVGRVPAGTQEVAFSLKGLNGNDAYEGFFKLPFATAPADPTIVTAWRSEQAIDLKLRKE